MKVIKELVIERRPLDFVTPRHAGAQLLKKMVLFHHAADEIFRANADRLVRAYEIVAPSQPDAGAITMTLDQIAMTVLQKKQKSELTPEMALAVHRAMVSSQNVQCEQVTSRQDLRYQVYPHHNLVGISQVKEWVRDFQETIVENATQSSVIEQIHNHSLKSTNPIHRFVRKARTAITVSRRTRKVLPNGCLGPSSVNVGVTENSMMTYRHVGGQQFNQEEKIILQYLDAWVLSRYLNELTPLPALGPMILRAVGMYEEHELDSAIGFTFLQELGVISPWENRSLYTIFDLKLPGHGPGFEETTQLLQEASDEFNSTAPLQDSMAVYRKDWGDLPVFCIDSETTVERDDGVSLEAVQNSETEYWVHVHVANPSAFIPPDSSLAKYAAQVAESVYLPERKYPMLHPSLTASQLTLAKGRPCLTFSARLSISGDVLEKRVIPGIINNVQNMTPHDVSVALGIDQNEETESVSLARVGGDFPTLSHQQVSKLDQQLPQSDVSILQKLLDLSQAVRHRRSRNGSLDFSQYFKVGSVFPRLFLGDNVPNFQLRDYSTSVYEGDPIIGIEKRTALFTPPTQMVTDLMILAGEVCASWCVDRNIPIPYRGVLRNPEPASPPEEFWKTIIEPQIAKYGHATQNDMYEYMRSVGQAAVASYPLEHVALGIPAYCKTSSPLRRHVDLYTHWQVEAAIRQEAKTGTSLIGSTDESYLPFSRAAVDEYASTVLHRERKVLHLVRASTRHWIVQALFRAFHFKEAPLPDTFQVRASEPYGDTHPGIIDEWDARVRMVLNDVAMRNGGIKTEDLWEVKICQVNTHYKNIEVEPLKLLKRQGMKEREVTI